MPLAFAEGTLQIEIWNPQDIAWKWLVIIDGPTDLTGTNNSGSSYDLQTKFHKGKTALTGSAVVGRYQFKDLLAHYGKQAGLSGSDLFSPENQDAMAIADF